MKKRISVLIGLSIAAGFAGFGQTPAAASHPAKIGVIQAQTALVNTKDGQRAISEMNARIDPNKKSIEKMANDIRDLQNKLQISGNSLAETARAELQRNIDLKTKSYNRAMEDFQAEAQAEQQKVLDELSQKMMGVIDKYAQANGYSVIIDVSNPNTPVLYASNTVEITKEIVELYDKTYPGTGGAAAPAATKPAPAQTKPVTPAITTGAPKKP